MIMNCKTIIDNYTEELKARVDSSDKTPLIAIVRVLGDDASGVYVKLKEKKCKEIGVKSEVIELPNKVSQEDLLNVIDHLNYDDKVTSILVQLPLPKHINEDAVMNVISPDKDADCLTRENVGALHSGVEIPITPCTPKGIMTLLKRSNVDLEGKTVLIINRSNIVGKPLQALMTQAHAGVFMAHSRTPKSVLEGVVNISDVIVTAVGTPDFIDASYEPQKEQVIIDVSMNRNADGKLCGDVSKELYNNSKLLITPVPGSVGPMTILSLIENTINLSFKY